MFLTLFGFFILLKAMGNKFGGVQIYKWRLMYNWWYKVVSYGNINYGEKWGC